MERSELTGLFYITPIANVASIKRLGLLSYNQVQVRRLSHKSVAMTEIQDRRSGVVVPGGRKLHDYVNLYVCARNPMMYKRQMQYRELCVLEISPDVLDLPHTVIADGNASGEYVRFAAAPGGLCIVNGDWTFAEYWTDPDQITAWKKKAAKCAEVLVPDRVDADYIVGAYVACAEAQTEFNSQGTGIPVDIDSHLFFR